MVRWQYLINFALLGGLIMATAAGGAVAAQGIQIYDANHWYWSYNGKPVLLLGGSDEDNLFNNPEMMMDNFDKLVRCGGNYIRGTLSWRDEGNVPPFERVGDKYDLRRFNPEFWRRVEVCCREAQKRGIIIQFEVWATFDYYRDNWEKSPWNPANNVNYTTENTHLVPKWDFHPASRRQPFFYSPPKLNNDRLVLQFQQAFVRKLLDVTLPFDNVLYCLDNETRAPAEWALYWGQFMRDEARKRGATIHVTEMWDPWNLHDPEHAITYEHPEVFDFCDVSQNNWQSGQTHYDRLLWYRDTVSKQAGGPRPINNVKIYGWIAQRRQLDPVENVERFWRNIFAGCASARYHRPGHGLGISDLAQQTIRAARNFTDAFNLFTCVPAPDLLSDRKPNEAYCLAKPGEVYAVYFPRGGDVSLNMGPLAGHQVSVRWFDPRKASFAEAQTVKAGDTLRLKSPSQGETWLVLVTPAK